MSCMMEYLRWLSNKELDLAVRQELIDIRGDVAEIKARFGSMLHFGTAGLRGVMGAGTNRMNIYTVRHVSQGLANLISSLGEEAARRGVVIGYDSRNCSRLFALETARVFAETGTQAYVFESIRPVPELSFAVRELHCMAGVYITASHNPKQYNGYKVYWEDGAQLPPDHAETVLGGIKDNDIFEDVYIMDQSLAEEKGLIRFVGEELDEKYLGRVLQQSVCPEEVRQTAANFKIVYTPLHGAGYELVPKALARLGFDQIVTVKEQMIPDGNFPTLGTPNPEEKGVFDLAVKRAQEQGSGLIIGTDPDADRVGVMVREHEGRYVSLTGNQVGCLLCDYLIRMKKAGGTLPADAVVVSSIVSSRMVPEICARYGVQFTEVLTGFKFIGEKIREFESDGNKTFLFGFEDSCGYLAGSYVHDKDGVLGSMLIAEMAAWYDGQGMTLFDAFDALCREFGYHEDRMINIAIEGVEALEKMRAFTEALREKAPHSIAGIKVKAARDYLSGVRIEAGSQKKQTTGLPRADVLYFEMEDGSTVVVRPSGTEPKVKFYMMVRGSSRGETALLLDRYELACRELAAMD